LPLYEYLCPKCGRFELIRKFSDATVTTCPTCGSEVQKLLSAPAIQFKGTGWYITDYAKKGSSDKSSTGGESAKAESQSDKAETTKSDAPAAKTDKE